MIGRVGLVWLVLVDKGDRKEGRRGGGGVWG